MTTLRQFWAKEPTDRYGHVRMPIGEVFLLTNPVGNRLLAVHDNEDGARTAAQKLRMASGAELELERWPTDGNSK
jgi:hypothetical protein